MTQEQLYQLALSFIPGIGAVTTRILVSYCGGIEAVFKTKKSQLLKIPSIGPKTAATILKNEALNLADKEAKFLEKNEINHFFYLDKDYPQRLKAYNDSPIVLYSKGNPFANKFRTVGIVGTRQPTEYGKLMTARIIQGLQNYDATIISGLAYGVDTIAHQCCVTKDMCTYGILGQGFPNIYPAQNRKLANNMLLNGGLITEFPSNTKPDRENFPKRNRIIAGLSDAIIVIESPRKGGSIITANYANEYFKDVFAVPGRINDERSEGCNKLIKQHKAALIESADDIAYIMRWDKESESEQQMSIPFDLTEEEEKIITHLKNKENKSVDHMHHALKIPVSSLSSTLLQLEFKGVIKSLPGKKYNLI